MSIVCARRTCVFVSEKERLPPQQTPDSSQPWEESLASVSHLDACRQREVCGGEGPFPLKSRLIAQLCPAHNSNQPPCLRSVKSQDRAGLAIATCR